VESELVLDPHDTDLIFAVRFVEGGGLTWPQIRMVISDAKTHVVLWGFVERVDGACSRSIAIRLFPTRSDGS
jgi:hypothetical protein